jgi:hypothetical protein
LSVKKSEFDALKSFLEKQSFLSCKWACLSTNKNKFKEVSLKKRRHFFE